MDRDPSAAAEAERRQQNIERRAARVSNALKKAGDAGLRRGVMLSVEMSYFA
jgi:hypothetical protein